MELTRWGEQPLRPRALIGLVAAALSVLVLAFGATVRPADSIAGSDVTVYETYGARMLDGAMPYRDFTMEYPPGASLMFVLPSIDLSAGSSADEASWSPVNATARRYYRGFTSFVLMLLAAIVVLTAVTLSAMRRPARVVMLSLAVVATSPMLIGQVLPERFDLWPAALTAAALAASVHGLHRLGGVLLGLGAAAKVYPVLLLPVLVIVVIRQRGAREAMFVAGATLATSAVVLLPFVIVSPSETWESLSVQFRGGLQIESLASSVLVMTGHAAQALTVLGLPPPAELATQGAGHGLTRTDLVGSGVGATKTVTNVLLAVALCLLWVGLARSRGDVREDLLRYAAATVAIVLVGGTVLSPQYLIWLIPLVPLVGGRRGVAAILCFVAAAVLTNIWFPGKYFEYQSRLDAERTAILLARNLALLATAAVLLLPRDTLTRGRALLRPRPVRASA